MITISLMVLLALLAVGLLSLSTISLRSSNQSMAMAEARANARLALSVALGELQKEMGPDMRISAESAIFDADETSARIEGIAQSRWLASYDSWGSWLNASYERPDGGGSLQIADTYTPRREAMFRRWLLSLPPDAEINPDAPDSLSGWNEENSVVLVGEGSLGDSAETQPDQVTRAALVEVDGAGRYAWWIGPENHRAKIDLASRPRDLAADQWETAHGSTNEVGVGALTGFRSLDDDGKVSAKLISHLTLGNTEVDPALVARHFFDLTATSKAPLVSVRTGHLKKDLSLLLEKESRDLPDRYRYDNGDNQEPSIRPMSPDLLAKGPKITERHFASWTNLRHYYRMYRNSSDANTGSIGSSGALRWDGAEPWTEAQVPLLYRDRSNRNQWWGDNSYHRVPVLAKLTFIYSLMTEIAGGSGSGSDPYRYRLFLVYTPVFTYWNPYNVELRIPDNTMGSLSSTYQVLPMGKQFFLRDTPQQEPDGLFTSNAHSFLRSGGGGEIVFRPGEIRLFSHPSISQQGNQFAPESLIPGFDPAAYGGDLMRIGRNSGYTEDERPGIRIQFHHSIWGGNVSYGNTPGSLCHTPFWLADSDRDRAFNWNIPVMYQNDWFDLSQTYTQMTPPGDAHIARWVFTDRDPVPVAYAQLVLKGLSEFDYESINWARDWRCRNWIQAPPFYFGNGMYISENNTIAHTQRLDNPYVMNFGPMSNAELPKVVAHIGERAFLGSGSNPFEQVTAVPALELPTAPVGSLAGFAGMRINPGYADPLKMNPDYSVESRGGSNTGDASYYYAVNKTLAYQSGVTGPGIGNSFIHPMLPREDVYKFFNNSVSADPANRGAPLDNISFNDTKAYCDYWDHVLLLNDALWDDYFLSSLADQTRPGASSADSLDQNLDRLVDGESLVGGRYIHYPAGETPEEVKARLKDEDGYLKAAAHLMVDGMFNVNSTSVDAWHALFAGIRERQLVYRDQNGRLRPVEVPSGKRIAVSRFNTPTTDQEMTDPATGVNRDDGTRAWSGVRFLDDDQLRTLAEKCVEQVKRRGPFLNFSEFINRRLSNDELGLMGALQSAIDYDDDSPDPDSINYPFKAGGDFMMSARDLGRHGFSTPEAVEGSRFAGIPGYVIQSDILKPIANHLSVRDDTFRIRTYGEALDGNGNVVARAWCEAIVQRVPEYQDPVNPPEEPARTIDDNGRFVENTNLAATNRRFGRRFVIESFRWLHPDEV
ncbi:hypothetical protein [Haloferula sp. A504]|uniref:hypothetical protein n=1 Tax=Haloferula sp. A504 TaxID=3373601 RepID=UPI0031BDEB7B|nr:hypothetical protein [Verrucomicrobiaceae bacterium E54]